MYQGAQMVSLEIYVFHPSVLLSPVAGRLFLEVTGWPLQASAHLSPPPESGLGSPRGKGASLPSNPNRSCSALIPTVTQESHGPAWEVTVLPWEGSVGPALPKPRGYLGCFPGAYLGHGDRRKEGTANIRHTSAHQTPRHEGRHAQRG